MMMKKFMVLAMVLGIASLATAAATFSVAGGTESQIVPGAIEVAPSDVITIEVVADFASNGFALEAFSSEGGTATPGEVNATLSFLPNPGQAVNADVADGYQLITAAGGSVFGASIEPGAAIYSFTFHVPELPFSTVIEIYGLDVVGTPGSYVSNAATFQTEAIAPLTLHVVPEPISMGLLGLGGLFLRRRS